MNVGDTLLTDHDIAIVVDTTEGTRVSPLAWLKKEAAKTNAWHTLGNIITHEFGLYLDNTRILSPSETVSKVGQVTPAMAMQIQHHYTSLKEKTL